MKKRILKQEHKEYIDELVKINDSRRWTYEEIKAKLEDTFEEILKIHNSTKTRYMKSSLNLSYKKLDLWRTSTISDDSKLRVLEAAYINI